MKKFIKYSLVFLLFVSIVVIRVLYGSYSELKEGLSYVNSDVDEAILHLSYAIKWHLPVNPFEDRALKEAIEIAKNLEKRGELKQALESYRIIRGAIYSTRSFYLPHRKTIEFLNDRISDLVAETEVDSPRWGITSRMELKYKSLLILERDLDPILFWVIVLEVGFVGWIASVLMFILKAYRNGRLDNRLALMFGSSFFLFYAAWVIGLWRA